MTGVAADDTAERHDGVATGFEQVLRGERKFEGSWYPNFVHRLDAPFERGAGALEQQRRDVFVEARHRNADARACRRHRVG